MGEWKQRWGYSTHTTKREGIYRMKDGGFLVTANLRHPRTGKREQKLRVLLDVKTIEEAQKLRDAMVSDARAAVQGRSHKTVSYAEFARSIFGRKVMDGSLAAKTADRWTDALTNRLVPAFGWMQVHDIRRIDLETWKAEQAGRVAKGELKPSTVNGWQGINLTILRAAVAEFELDRDPTRGVTPLSTTDHATYTEENPNALTAAQTSAFISHVRSRFPQHHAIVLLGFVTGLRPSTLRPLRVRGPKPDVLWSEDAILVRRSNAIGQTVRETTKTKRHQRIHLPASVMGVLAGHVALLAVPPLSLRWGKAGLWWREPMATSELLFPARHGRFLTRSALQKTFNATSVAIGLHFMLTPRGMRRTFQDLARAAEVHDVVTRSISGHSTEAMQRHYSTAQAEEQRTGIDRVLRLVKAVPRSEPGSEKKRGAL